MATLLAKYLPNAIPMPRKRAATRNAATTKRRRCEDLLNCTRWVSPSSKTEVYWGSFSLTQKNRIFRTLDRTRAGRLSEKSTSLENRNCAIFFRPPQSHGQCGRRTVQSNFEADIAIVMTSLDGSKFSAYAANPRLRRGSLVTKKTLIKCYCGVCCIVRF